MFQSKMLMSMMLAFAFVGTVFQTQVGFVQQPGASASRLFLPITMTPCWPDSLPAGAIDGQPAPVFCNIENQGPDTAQEENNSWSDRFEHDLSFADFSGTNYRIFETVGFVHQTLHWRHADHWMVDVASHSPEDPPRYVRGGGLMRPNQTFHFENGKLVVEAEVAAGMDAYDGNAWPELVVSTGDQPTDVGSLYAYELFPEDWTLGCRLQASRFPVCALQSNNGDKEAGKGSARVWEMSAHQDVGSSNYGGSPFEGREDAWHLCGSEDPDMRCRDRFRLELTETSLTLYVNDVKYFEQQGIPSLPDDLLSGDVYVYFASMVVSHPDEAVRFHWDDLRVNPDASSNKKTPQDFHWYMDPGRFFSGERVD